MLLCETGIPGHPGTGDKKGNMVPGREAPASIKWGIDGSQAYANRYIGGLAHSGKTQYGFMPYYALRFGEDLN